MEKQKSNFKWYVLALLSSLTAAGVHFYLTSHFYDLSFGLLEGKSACNINSTFNCDVVSASPYAHIMGTPIALWGALFNLFFAGLITILQLGLSEHSAKLKRYVGISATLLLGASLIMGIISLTRLTTYCLFCIATYVLSLLSFIGALKLASFNFVSSLSSDIASLFKEMKWVLASLLAIPILALIISDQFKSSRGGVDLELNLQANFNDWMSAQSYGFSDEGLSRGPVDAKMKIVEFADFRCPHCKHAAPTMKAFTESHPDVRFTFKVFPLDGGCNPSPQMQDGPGVTCYLAKSAHCAEQISQKGFALHYWIFEHQEQIVDSNSAQSKVKEFLQTHSISESSLETCVSSEETLQAIERQAQEGLNAQIRGTPSIFVNGRALRGGQSLIMLERAYKALK